MKSIGCVIIIFGIYTFCGDGPPSSYAAQNEIGIFFDSSGVGNCSNSFNTPMDAYIVVRNLSSSESISGWELKIESDEGIFVVAAEITGGNLNMGSFPNMVVGLNEPLFTENEQIVLAKLTIFPTVNGGLYLGPAEEPSVAGAATPVLLFPEGNLFLETNRFWPDDRDSQLWFSNDCEQVVSQQGVFLETYEIEGASPFNITMGRILHSASENYPAGRSYFAWEQLLTASEFCFVGHVDTTKYLCYSDRKEGVQSIGIVKFKVSKPYWGVHGNEMVIETRVNRPDNCVKYSRAYFDSFDEGDEYFVVGSVFGDRFRAMDSGIFKIIDGELYNPRSTKNQCTEIEELVGIISEKKDVLRQTKISEIICTINIPSLEKNSISSVVEASIIKVLKGKVPQGDISINVEYDFSKKELGEFILPPSFEEGKDYLVFLEVSNGDEYQCVNGIHGAYELVDDILYGMLGQEWGPISLLSSILEGGQ